MSTVAKILTAAERNDLARCEAIIERGKQTFIEVTRLEIQNPRQAPTPLENPSQSSFGDFCFFNAK
jgi:hypothetical protein